MERQGSPEEGKNLIFTFSKERSGKVKGHSVNVISIPLSFSPTIYFSRFLSSLFVSLPGDSSNGDRVKEKREKGVKNGDEGLVFLLGPNRAGLWARVCTSSFYLPTILSLSLSIPLRGTRGV